jgi:glycosyltransferase involved in cell wall biosynthesis
LRFVYRFVDFALYVGTNNKNYYLKHGLDKKKLIFAPHAVENERFYNQGGNFDHRLKELRKELKIADDDIVVLFAGKFIPIKDPLILINAANKINNVKFKFIFAGNGELENEMKNLALKNKNIHFLPFQNQSNMPILYRLGDVFVLCSSSETWGLSVNEAMASERAVLCSDKAGCAVDLVKDNENGFIFKAGDLISLLDKLNKFAKDSVHHFGQYSMKQIKEYSHEKICTAVEGLIIDEIING